MSNRLNASRTSREILDDLIKAVKDLNDIRDKEWDFFDRHGISGLKWRSDDVKEHDRILESIIERRKKVNDLAREASGKDIDIC